MVVAAIRPEREAELRRLLAGMNRVPGHADPVNALIPFGRIESLHFARFVIFDDRTTEDIGVYGVPAPVYPLTLAFLGDCDGDSAACLADLVREGGQGLRRLFLCCEGFAEGADVIAWMLEREHRPAAFYTNWRGRTMRQIREEAALSSAVAEWMRADSSLGRLEPRDLHAALRERMQTAVAGGRIGLTPESPTPLQWSIANIAHAAALPIAALVLLPALLIYLPFFAVQLRRREKSDPEIVPPVDPAHASRLALIEDREPTNQFSALGSLKPGVFRRWLTAAVLVAIDYGARHIYVRGRLARVHTIHAARWVFLDGGRRVFFGSNYDGSLESYMDDFINKVSFGLNLVFSNGLGYPAARWLVLDGAHDEQRFKAYLRRHQLPTEVWYNGHAGLTAHQLERNMRLRQGLEAPSLSRRALADWCRLL
jgi:hypothetical protein